MVQFEGIPPHFLIPLVGTVFGTVMTGVLLYPIVRAYARRIEERNRPQMPVDVSDRLARIEAAVESIAIEVERISESQRFLTKIQSERIGAGTPPEPRR
jgi:hypothetical protein